ncbi:MAG: thioredoxin domain-containing protein [Gemmataceae bacterium]
MPSRIRLLALLLLLPALGAASGQEKDKEKEKRQANHLIKESSPYLLQHAYNPVNWYPWGPEAFAKAKKEGKLVFLSIGYSSCHWCHVMERESFANEAVAKLLNDWFVCIKVDREERPDIDHIYMTALNQLGSQGGWPLSMFLTADGRPIIGGTYWPPDDKEIDGEKVHGFKSLLKIVHDAQKEAPEKIEKQAEKLSEATVQALAGATRGIALGNLDRKLLTDGIDQLKERHDPVHGGFGSPTRGWRGTKFPTPPLLDMLLTELEREKNKDLQAILERTLDHMARGGIYDHLGGGFHRYSTERTWTVPHFEKMLYDNAQLVEIYARAYKLTGNPFYKRVVDETLGFIARELTSPEGGIYSALDADSEEEEGRFYVWTGDELNKLLGDSAEAKLFRKVYGLDGPVNFEGKYYILTLPKSYAEAAKEAKLSEAELEKQLAPLRKKLFEVRAKRPRPFLDKKILTAWNGQMIAGYATAGRLLEEPKYTEAARKAADFLLGTLRTQEGKLLRTYGAAPGAKAQAKLNAYLDDYAYLVHGLLALHDATGAKKWLDEATALTDTTIKLFDDPKQGGYYYTSSDHEKLFARAKDQYDGAQPSGNSVTVSNLVRLWIKTKDDRYAKLAENSLKAFSTSLKLEPMSLMTMSAALDVYLVQKEKK